MNYYLLIILALLLILWYCVRRIVYVTELCNYNNEQYAKWEHEYWLLRGSDAIRKDYSVRLSFIPRGEDDCIKKKGE